MMFDEKKFNEITPEYRRKVSKKETAKVLSIMRFVTRGEVQIAILNKLLGDTKLLDKIEFVYDGSYLPSRILLCNTDGLISYEPKTETEQNNYYLNRHNYYSWSLETYKKYINILLKRDNVLFVHFGNTSDIDYNNVLNYVYNSIFHFNNEDYKEE